MNGKIGLLVTFILMVAVSAVIPICLVWLTGIEVASRGNHWIVITCLTFLLFLFLCKVIDDNQ